jgi:hypothetical protein
MLLRERNLPLPPLSFLLSKGEEERIRGESFFKEGKKGEPAP